MNWVQLMVIRMMLLLLIQNRSTGLLINNVAIALRTRLSMGDKSTAIMMPNYGGQWR